MLADHVLDGLRVAPGKAPRLARRNPGDTLGLPGKEEVAELIRDHAERTSALQQRLWAERSRSVLLVLQGMDTSGKDGTIKHVLGGLNPSAVRIAAFSAPTAPELAQDYLWRVHARCPARGHVGVFNRSHYEDVVTVRVLGLADEDRVARRLEHIRAFERMLADEGTVIVKCFLHIGRDEQRERLLERITDPDKAWKFDAADLAARARWDDYMLAYEQAIEATTADHAPWYVVPADRKWVRNAVVAELLLRTLQRMDPQTPPPAPELASLADLLRA
ncbi:MAG: polyphosphate kinase 2 family protein [Thermoleophilia bacterium]|nr:polyphosphate kinase 2 family protein [Thermoleophilia bacterium]